MFETDEFSIECGTCLATGTTACNDCVVTHLLANDDGPINLVTVPLAVLQSPQERVVALFERAGLLDDPIEFVPSDVFESHAVDRSSMVIGVR